MALRNCFDSGKRYVPRIDELTRKSTELKQSNERLARLKPILLKIRVREEIIQDRLELEKLQHNPDRLKSREAFNARKREDAMIRGIKTLEKITAEILTELAEWEASYEPYLYSGLRYPDRIAQQEQAYQELKSSLRSRRKST